MPFNPQSSIAKPFELVEAPRIERSKAHLLIDILTIAILAIICGADGWVGMESYGNAKAPWLRTFLALPNGIPSHDTFSRVFARLDPEQLQNAFLSWVRSVSQLTEGEVIAIDGKRVRRSYDEGNQGSLYEDVQQLFDWAHQQSFENIDHDFYETTDANHGRIVKRRCWSLGQVEGLLNSE